MDPNIDFDEEMNEAVAEGNTTMQRMLCTIGDMFCDYADETRDSSVFEELGQLSEDCRQIAGKLNNIEAQLAKEGHS